jgi:hypothetical protein
MGIAVVIVTLLTLFVSIASPGNTNKPTPKKQSTQTTAISVPEPMTVAGTVVAGAIGLSVKLKQKSRQ